MKSDLTDAENQKKADNKTLKAAKTANKKASTAKKKANNKVKSTAKSLLKTRAPLQIYILPEIPFWSW